LEVADATYKAAKKRWPSSRITLRHGDEIIRDSDLEESPANADKIDRRPALGYFNYAVSYHAAADLIFNHGLTATHPDAPASFVYYQAIELYLKAFLRLRGVSASRLRGIGHDPQRLRKRSIERGLSFGKIENNVLDWFISTEAWTRNRYLEVGSTTSLLGEIVPTACANLKTSVAAALRSSGHIIQSPKLKRPFSSVLPS
jgi:hypothetical protein